MGKRNNNSNWKKTPKNAENPENQTSSDINCNTDPQSNPSEKKSAQQRTPFEWKPFAQPAPKNFEDLELEKKTIEALNWIIAHTKQDFHCILESQIRQAVHQWAHIDQVQVAALLKWMLYHPSIETIKENWKDKVTDAKYRGMSMKIASSGNKFSYAKKSDDLVYRENSELLQLLPRGMVFLRHKPDLENDVELALFGNRKFFGRVRGDDDDSDLCSTTFRDQKYHSFLVSTKANGEACQVALLKDKETWLIGSKNRKLVAKEKGHVAMYTNDKMYSFGAEMATCFFEYYEKMGPQKQQQLKDFLSLTGLTLNFEFESTLHQHIVPLTKTQLVFIGCSGIHITGAFSFHPIITKAFAANFGFPSVLDDDTIFPASAAEDKCAQVVREWNIEGAVLVLMDQNMQVVDFVKVKTWWYVLLRAIREKIAFDKNRSVLIICRNIVNRLKVLGGEMGIPEVYVEKFVTLAQSFVQFITSDPKRKEIFRESYPLLWQDFLTLHKLALDHKLIEQEIPSANLKLDTSDLPLLVLTQGIPGLGKSFLGDAVIKVLAEKFGLSCLNIAQDDFYHLGKKKAGPACIAHTQKMLEEGKHKIIILARNNANIQQYKAYLDFELQGLCKIAFTSPEEWSTRNSELIYMCMCAVTNRQASDKSHPTSSMELLKLAELPLFFAREFSEHTSAIRIKMMDSTSLLDQFDVELVKDLIAKKKPWDMDAMKILKLDQPDHVSNVSKKFHRNIDDLSNEFAQVLAESSKVDIPALGSYLAIGLSSDSTAAILEATKKLVGEKPTSWNSHATHITLVHSYNFWPNRTKWEKASALIGREAVLRNMRLAFSPSKLATASAQLFLKPKNKGSQVVDLNKNKDLHKPQNEQDDQEEQDISGLVGSGHPHLTVWTAPNVAPKQSVQLLASFDAKEMLDMHLSEISGTIQLISLNY